MLAAVWTKALRDRWISMAVAVTTLGLFLLLGLAAYQEIDLAIYNELPDAMRAVVGIPDGADATSLAFTAIYGSYGALTLCGVAISLGSSSIAGEERDGTLGLLLSTPHSRTSVLLQKTLALLLLTGVGAVVLLAAGYAAPAMLGVTLGDAAVGALVVHMWFVAVFHGAVALAVGAWTGRRSLATGMAAGVLVLGFIGDGLLPFVERLADGVRALPWHYYTGSDPFLNGADPAHLAVLGAGTVLLVAGAWLGLRRRDLRSGDGGTSLVERLREHPLTRSTMERLAGSARVSAIWVKTVSDHQGLLLIVAIVMFAMMGVMIGVMYAAIEGTLAALSDLPDAILAIAGGGDASTPEGWYRLETFSLMAPGAVMALTVTIGSRALAGEERDRTMGLLLASPIRRSRVVLEKTAALVLHGVLVGVATFAGVVAGNTLAGLGMDIGHIAAASLLATLLGLVFGALALAIGAATGRTRAATYGTIGVVLLAYLASNILPLADSLAGYARWSPWHYYASSYPLVNGLDVGHALVLLVLAVVLLAAAVVLFERRDLRQG
jgi:ABC-2 type transport system permease protein